MPLGQKLWDETSKAVGKRILDCSDKGIHAEVSFVGQIKGCGRLAGIDGKIVGTPFASLSSLNCQRLALNLRLWTFNEIRNPQSFD